MRRTLARYPVALLGVLVLGQGTARADPSETSAARADRLFREGKMALEAGRSGEACPKLAESQQLDPATGTLLALALCHEAEGKTASAWSEFKGVREASQQKGRADRVALADKHMRALEPFLSKLTISVTGGADLRGKIVVRRDGEVVAPDSWQTPVYVDAGEHVVDASMPGAPPWRSSVRVGPNGDAQVIVVPTLDGAPVASVAPTLPPPPPEEAKPLDRRQKLALVVGGGGVLLLGVGGVVGLVALSDRSNAISLCPTSPCKNADGVSTNDRAKTEAWVSDIGFGLGLAGLTVAAYLYFVHPTAPAVSAPSSIHVDVGPGAVSLTGAF